MALATFAPTNYATLGALASASSRVAIPGGDGTALLITNIGPMPASVLLGSSSVVATDEALVVLPNQSVAVAVGTATHVAAIGIGGTGVLKLAQGV